MTFFECFHDFARIVVDIVVEMFVEIAVDKLVESVDMLARSVDMTERSVDRIVRLASDFEFYKMFSHSDFRAFADNMINIHASILIDTKSLD